jgi:hypothetical protein
VVEEIVAEILRDRVVGNIALQKISKSGLKRGGECCSSHWISWEPNFVEVPPICVERTKTEHHILRAQ